MLPKTQLNILTRAAQMISRNLLITLEPLKSSWVAMTGMLYC